MFLTQICALDGRTQTYHAAREDPLLFIAPPPSHNACIIRTVSSAAAAAASFHSSSSCLSLSLSLSCHIMVSPNPKEHDRAQTSTIDRKLRRPARDLLLPSSQQWARDGCLAIPACGTATCCRCISRWDCRIRRTLCRADGEPAAQHPGPRPPVRVSAAVSASRTFMSIAANQF